MRVLIAPDAFKGTLRATRASEIIGEAAAAHGLRTDLAPIADGGDGTLDVLLAHGFTSVDVEVVDAAGRARRALIGVRDAEAVIELAEICGLVTVSDLPLDAWHRTTLGLGLAARSAIDAGCTSITLTLGGSASVDGGIGLLTGLGFSVLDRDDATVSPDLAGMARAERITVPELPPVRWRALVDVTTPLVGRESSAMVFGAQKGLDADDRMRGDEALKHWAEVLQRTFGVDVREVPGGGAAGGVAAGAHAALGAELVSGARAVLDLIGVEARLRDCDLVVTGEGSFDAQSLLGKGTGAVIEAARAVGRPVLVIAGVCEHDAVAGVERILTCAEVAGSAASARQEPARWLRAAADRLFGDLAAAGGARD